MKSAAVQVEKEIGTEGTKTIYRHPAYGLMVAKAVELSEPLSLCGTQNKSQNVIMLEAYQAHKEEFKDQTFLVADNLIFRGYFTHAGFSTIVGNIGRQNQVPITLDVHQSLSEGGYKVPTIDMPEVPINIDLGFLEEYKQKTDALANQSAAMMESSGKKELRASLAAFKANLEQLDNSIVGLNKTASEQFDIKGQEVMNNITQHSKRKVSNILEGCTPTLLIEKK